MSAPTSQPPLPPLARSVDSLPGVGSERAAQLARLKLFTIGDLLLHRPRRYEDRRHFENIAELTTDAPGTIRGRVVAAGIKRYRHGQKSVVEVIIDDGTARLHCRWWNLPFMLNYFAVGDEVFVFGRLTGLKPRTTDHPETEVIEGGVESSIHINRIAPIYPLTEGLPQRWLRGLIWRTLPNFEGELKEPRPELKIAERLPSPRPSPAPASREREKTKSAAHEFLPRRRAIQLLHFPGEEADIENARRRLALDEFVELQLAIRERRQRFEARARAIPCAGTNRLIKPFLARLGFALTGAQTRVLRDIRRDLGGAHPMRRLLQGDVGSGKTVVAACAALMALESGRAVALMAPTEILAGQHFETFQRWFEPLGLEVRLLTGSRKSPPRDTSAPRLTIGTHALLEAGADLDRLGLVIIDEQHKFGVAQREQLVRKGNYPHLLVMTATPIPRTLGLTLYGELDVSVIDELPAGRGRVRTFIRGSDTLPKVWDFIREKLAAGRQAYVVYPRVEESGPGGLKAVTKEHSHLQKLLAPYRVGLLHGRLPSAEKERVMAAFRNREIQVLLATPLIEVGVDVANATIMLIEDAAQFGLAQLHQLRGRIGRGALESHCILIADPKNPEARDRLRVLEQTADGFKIAEADLKLRGPGELLGREQSGLPSFRFGDLADDLELVELARGLVAGGGPERSG